MDEPPEIPDGIITDFTAANPYVSGTVSVWLNGLRLQDDLETGFTEVPPTTVRLKEPPEVGDTVELQYEKV